MTGDPAESDVGGSSSADPVLELRDVVVRYGSLTAVDVEHLVVHPGSIVGIVGANGAGKTTLFDAISGFVRLEAGQILLDGQSITSSSASRRARLGLGRSFQNAVLYESLTVAETIAVAFERDLAAHGVLSSGLRDSWQRRRQVRPQVDELIERMGLGAFHGKFVAELSTGSRRIVDLACVMAQRPRVLLLDEPSSGIAQREVEALEPVLKRVRSELDCTMLVVEHDIPLIRSLAPELFAMETGRIIAHGSPEDVLSNEEVIRSYLGTDASVVERSGKAP